MLAIDDKDYGTPARESATTVTLEIDGREVTVSAGTSVMRAAALADVMVPRLCATDSLEAFGSCRLCLIEIEGRNGVPASCTTPAENGMKVHTQSERLAKLRRNVMELYMSDHPLDPFECKAGGKCELHEMAVAVGLEHVRYASPHNHLDLKIDDSNPYFAFDPTRCILCSRCVRACNDVQGTFALTIEGRGFASQMTPGQHEHYNDSECVSCGACVQACPTDALMEKSLLEHGRADRAVITTCGYCGVGCSFKAEMRGDEIVRMVPNKNGLPNHGHSCVKGRFAWGYATHPDRVRSPMIRRRIEDPWQEVSWDEALTYAASELKRVQAKFGRGSIGGITSSRCTNEEAYLVQKMVRAAFGNNNVDTCARVCHSPTGYGLKTAFGTPAGTQDFDSILASDVIMVIGANPTEGHPVFSSIMKRRLRQGAKLIVVDPRAIELVHMPHVTTDFHLQLTPGTNVALLNALAHVIIIEKLADEDFVAERCIAGEFASWRDFIIQDRNSPDAAARVTGVPADQIRGAARLFARGPNSAIYYGLGVTEHSQGSTSVLAMTNLAMITGMLGRAGVGINPLRGQNNVQGSNDVGSFPHELTGYRHVSDPKVRSDFEHAWHVTLDPEPGLRIPNMFDAALDGSFKGIYVEGEDIAQSDPNSQHVDAALKAMEIVIVQDIFLNETAKYAHVFLPGSSFLEKDGTFTNAERRISRVRKVLPPLAGKEDWQVTCELSTALGYPMNYSHPSEIMDEIARLTPTFTGVSYAKLDRLGGVQWPCNDAAPEGTPIMHVGEFVRGRGRMLITEYVPTTERTTRRYPLILTTGRILTQYNVGTQTRRTQNVIWHAEDRLEIHPHDAEQRGIRESDWVEITSRAGSIALRATLTERVAPGVVYTTFHHPESGANVVTTENSDWATNCPEYKVTAVEVMPTSHRPERIPPERIIHAAQAGHPAGR
ncbi:MAG TPA: formate dehydrogenase subunit alpha [Candidatus Binataceae bacterium]|nr:formate dehydrogenase subunit alpha [Candidatus Binataceae bacterium]